MPGGCAGGTSNRGSSAAERETASPSSAGWPGTRLVETRHPHAEQPHRARRVELARAAATPRGARRRRRWWPPTASGRAVCVEKSSKRTLMPIVRPRRSWRASVSHSSLGQRSSTGSSARGRAGRGRRWSRATPTWPRAPSRCARSSSKRASAARCGPRRAPNQLGELLVRGGRERGRASRCRAPRAARRSSGRCRGRGPGEALGEAARGVLGGSARRSRPASRRPRRPSPRACWARCRSSSSARCAPGSRPSPAARPPFGALDAGQVEVGLVEPDDLDALDVRPAGPPSPRASARGRLSKSGGDEDGVGAAPPGPLGGRGREDAEAARLVARGGHDRPRRRCRRPRPACPAAPGGAAARR